MPLEVATFITELQQTNPLSTDKKKQGDDHLTLIKRVLQNTFPDASGAFYFPRAQVKSADFSVVKADQNDTFIVSSAVLVSATLPTLTGADDGWSCHFMKFGVGLFFIVPTSGLLISGGYSVSAARRMIPGAKTTAIWAGGQWYVTRALNTPIGTVLDYGVPNNAAPTGYEFANGQVLATGYYPEYFAAVGNGQTVDHRGRASYGREGMGGTAHTGRLAGVIDGTAVWNGGGADVMTWGKQYMPNETQVVNIGAGQGNHGHTGSAGFTLAFLNTGLGPTQDLFPGGPSAITVDPAVLPAMSGTFAFNGGQTQQAMPNLPPAIVLNKLLVVE